MPSKNDKKGCECKVDCIAHAIKKCEIVECKRKFRKVARGLLSTGLIASTCEIDNIKRADRIDFKLQSVLSATMNLNQSYAGNNPGVCDNYPYPVAWAAMANAQWPDLRIWECYNPQLDEFLFVYRGSYVDIRNRKWDNVEILVNDQIRLIDECELINNGKFLKVVDLSNQTDEDNHPYYCGQGACPETPIYLDTVQTLNTITSQVCLPENYEESNFNPLVTNSVQYMMNGVPAVGKVAVWRESCPAVSPCNKDTNVFIYIAGYGVPACKPHCSPCVKA